MIAMSLDDRSGRINHGSATPLPVQVAADIEADIDVGRLAPDTRLPSEMELSAQYGVARVSIRRAIEVLRERGKVVTVHGRGTYVAAKPLSGQDAHYCAGARVSSARLPESNFVTLVSVRPNLRANADVLVHSRRTGHAVRRQASDQGKRTARQWH